ncbi:serine/threonine protein kinase [Streptomyces syringium]|uniref:serine/threonine protein kinase n=1 Tax=Streptomyces syringium TaxID=76729 RepID=UPI003D89B565
MSALSAPRTAVTRRIGPYTVITRLDGGDRSGPALLPVPENRFIARSADGERTVLIGVPRAGADHGRFAAEAEASRYLLGPWSAPATETDASGEVPWHARPYVPALPLPTALAVHGGPLPERTVRALGAALVENLAILHGQGLTHAGLSPAAVLLAADGPRLTCFGAVRAAAPDGEPRSGHPALESGSLPPEQATGERPHPVGDIYALGAVLAYAATGHTVPERDELPAALRGPITACLSRDPASRTQAAALLEEFTRGAGQQGAGAHPDTVVGEEGRAAGLLVAGWLPGRVIAAIARQSAAVLAAEIQPESGEASVEAAPTAILTQPASAEPGESAEPPGEPGELPGASRVTPAETVVDPGAAPAGPSTVVLAEPAHRERARTDR